jgi:hypothetical protein
MAYYSGLPMPPIGGNIPPLTGKYFFVDPAHGSDGNRGDGMGSSKAFDTVYKGEAALTSGHNDVCFLVPDGATTGFARLSAALAATVDSTATVGTLVWDKNAAHLIGAGPCGFGSSRASIRAASGTHTMATFGAAAFITISGNGCYFKNINFNQSFSTGGEAEICVTVSGNYNVFEDCQFAGNQDAVAAADTDSRSLKVTGGYNLFRNCVIGYESATARRSDANASLELSGTGCNSNYFENCLFPFKVSAAGVLGIIVPSAINGLQYFDNCKFINWGALTGGSTMTALATIAATPNGALFLKDCSRLLITDWGTDATSQALIYVQGSGDEDAVGDEIGRAQVSGAS